MTRIRESRPMTQPIKILLDTDIGSDPDDAIGLAYLLASPRVDLMGVTTVSGDVNRRAACAQVIRDAAGRDDVPIHPGTSNVLFTGPGQPMVPQYETIVDHPHRTDWPEHSAVEFMRRTIRDNPGEITLVCTGPLTNVALLMAMDNEIPSMLRSLVTMNGCFSDSARQELNAMVDPFATALVYRAQARNHLCIGMEATHGCSLTVQQVRQHFLSPQLKLVCSMADGWLDSPSDIRLNDTVAAVVAANPHLCDWEPGHVSAAISLEANAPLQTRLTPMARGPHQVSRNLKVEGVRKELLSTFTPQPQRLAV